MGDIPHILRQMEAAAKSSGGALSEEQAVYFSGAIRAEIETLIARMTQRDMRYSDAWFRPAEQDLLRNYLSRAFYARYSGVRPVYNHLLITAAREDLPSARGFAERLAGSAAEFFCAQKEDFVRALTEEQFLSCCDDGSRQILLEKLGNCRILLLPEFEASDLDRFEAALESLGVGRYAVILCVSDSVSEAIRAHSARDYRLARYLLRQSYRYTDKSARDAYEYACRQLEDGGLRLTEEFKVKLELYMEAVYPEAVLHGAEFVRDLLIRIEDTRASALRFSPSLTAADVPYSRKAELLAQAGAAEHTAAQQTEGCASEADMPPAPGAADAGAGPAENPALPCLTAAEASDRSVELDGAREWLEARNRSITDHPRSILLVSMSTFPRDNRMYPNDFEDDAGNSFVGRYQLDPVPKKLAWDLKKTGSALDNVILLCTKETEAKSDVVVQEKEGLAYRVQQVSPVEFFSQQMTPYLNPRSENPIRCIKLFKEQNGVLVDDFAGGFQRAVDTLRELLSEGSRTADAQGSPALYLDIHGGLRDAQMIFLSIVSLLETDQIEFAPHVYTVQIGDRKRNEKSRIVRNNQTLEMYQFVSGIREVINNGKIDSLKSYLKRYYPNDSTANGALEKLEKIAVGISWCDINLFEKGLTELASYDWNGKESGMQSDNSFIRLFRQNIEHGYDGILTREPSVPNEIRWCLRQGFFQQALALAEARIPMWLINNRVFLHDPEAVSGNGKRIPPAEQFNACVFFVKTNGDLANNPQSSFLKYFTKGKKSATITQRQYEEHLKPLLEAVCDVNALRIRMRTECVTEGRLKLAPGTHMNIDFAKPISANDVIAFLNLHHIFKTVRNESMHVRPFNYDAEKLKVALHHYLIMCDEMVHAVKNPPPAAEADADDTCIAIIVKEQNGEYLLQLGDGKGLGILKKEDVEKSEASASKLIEKASVPVRIVGREGLASRCVLAAQRGS